MVFGLGIYKSLLFHHHKRMEEQVNSFDFILDTVSAPYDVDLFVSLLRHDGALVLVGLPGKPFLVKADNLVLGRRSLAGSLIGGISETQQMLDYCALHGISSDIELIPIQKINEAYERTIESDVKYRFVIDMASLAQPN